MASRFILHLNRIRHDRQPDGDEPSQDQLLGKSLHDDLITKPIEASLVYNLIDDAAERQVGFARVISDQVRFAYIGDVFVLSSHRGQGRGLWLVETVIADPRLRSVGHRVLATVAAQRLYRKFGFEPAVEGRYLVMKN